MLHTELTAAGTGPAIEIRYYRHAENARIRMLVPTAGVAAAEVVLCMSSPPRSLLSMRRAPGTSALGGCLASQRGWGLRRAACATAASTNNPAPATLQHAGPNAAAGHTPAALQAAGDRSQPGEGGQRQRREYQPDDPAFRAALAIASAADTAPISMQPQAAPA